MKKLLTKKEINNFQDDGAAVLRKKFDIRLNDQEILSNQLREIFHDHLLKYFFSY